VIQIIIKDEINKRKYEEEEEEMGTRKSQFTFSCVLQLVVDGPVGWTDRQVAQAVRTILS
jgi:hypothetical protein